MLTAADRVRMGYAGNPQCALCGAEDDTFIHRVAGCKNGRVARTRKRLGVEAACLSCDVASPLDRWGMVDIGGVPRPPAQVEVRWVKWGGAPSDERALGGGVIFTDGSAYPCQVSRGMRAGWAAVR